MSVYASRTGIPTEAEEGRRLVAYLRIRNLPFTHIANETGSGQGARFQGIRNKQQGLSKGFPDYLVVVPRQGQKKLIAIELKRQKGSRITPEQREWLTTLSDAGIESLVCFGADHAIRFIEEVQNRK